MITLPVHNQAGDHVGTLGLRSDIFEVPVKDAVVHQVVLGLMNNNRSVVAHVKDRSEVSGGGKKPWRQKGTGRARHGSSRSPLWVGGGVTFGPNNARNFSQKVNKKMKAQVTRMLLSDKVAGNHMFVLNALEMQEKKTKLFVELLAHLPIAKKKTLIALDNNEKEIVRVSRNIPYVKVVHASRVGVLDLLAYPYFLITVSGVKAIEQRFSRKEVRGFQELKI